MTVLPSSHYSIVSLKPFPQFPHKSGYAPLQFQLASIRQLKHPSPDELFPSSQASPGSRFPFPQNLQTSGVVGDPPVQVQPGSIVQLVQPSNGSEFPSSQNSLLDASIFPFPQSFIL